MQNFEITLEWTFIFCFSSMKVHNYDMYINFTVELYSNEPHEYRGFALYIACTHC